MKYAVANKNGVRCPDCKTEFEVSEDLYNAQVECPQCSCQFKIEPPVQAQPRRMTETAAVRPVVTGGPPVGDATATGQMTSSGIQIGDDDEDLHRPMSTVRLSRNENTMEQQRRNMPAPQDVDTKGMETVVPDGNKVSCPKCKEAFEIADEFLGTVAECPDCEAEFVIASAEQAKKSGPGQKLEEYSSIRVRSASGPDPSTSANYRTTTNRRRSRGVISQEDDSLTTSGIEIAQQDELAPAKYQATATVRLSRNMTMQQRAKAREAMAPPPPPEKVAKLPEVYPRNDEVACPGCKSSFEISSEYYGAVAECPDCEAEFLIKPPRKAARAAEEKPKMAPTPVAEPAKASPSPPPEAKPAAPVPAKTKEIEMAKAEVAEAKAARPKKEKTQTSSDAKKKPAKVARRLTPGMIVGVLIGAGVLLAVLIVIIALALR